MVLLKPNSQLRFVISLHYPLLSPFWCVSWVMGSAYVARVLTQRGVCCRVRAAGGGVSRGGVPRRRGRHVSPRRLPLLPHPRTAAASAAPPLTCPPATRPPPHPSPHPSSPSLTPPPPRDPTHPRIARAPRYPYRSRLWHTRERQVRQVSYCRSRGWGGDILVNIG